MADLQVWTPFFDDLDWLQAMVATIPEDVPVYAVDGRHATFEGDTVLTPGAEAWCDEQANVTYCAPGESRLPWGSEYDGPRAHRAPQYETARYANYEVLDPETWTLKLDTDERVLAFDQSVLADLDSERKYAPGVDVLAARGLKAYRVYQPAHWTFWLADVYFPRSLHPRSTPLADLVRIAAQTRHQTINAGGYVPGSFIKNVGAERPGDYQDRRADQLEAIGRTARATEYRTGRQAVGGEIPEQDHLLGDPADWQTIRLRERDWRVLLVLDACRWDVWNNMFACGERVYSHRSCTNRWIDHLGRAVDWSDVYGITANPIISSRTPPTMDRCEPVWDDRWRTINGVPTVDPYDVTDRVLAALRRGESSVYAHYIQPHGPYPKVDPSVPIYGIGGDDADDALDVSDQGIPNEFVAEDAVIEAISDSDHWLTREHLREAYRANLRWVWDAIQPLFEYDVVVTADHGEFLGERVAGEGRYGHPCHTPHETLLAVPWYEPSRGEE